MHDGATCYDYDLIVIGSGPGGQRAAIQAAKLGRRTLIVERQTVVGGVCINTGTIPSKTLREAVMHLSGFREQKVYGASNTMKRNITMGDLHVRTDFVIRNEIEVTRHQLLRNQIDLAEGAARFIDAHRICIDSPASGMHQLVTAEKFVIAVGTVATRDPSIPFDGQHIVISDDILGLQTLPRSLTVIGAGYLVVVCLLPEFLIAEMAVPFYFGGTSLLIVVSVTMDTVAQIQSHLLAHQYEGLIKKARLKGPGRR